MIIQKHRILLILLTLLSCTSIAEGRTLTIEHEFYKYDKEKKTHSYSQPKVRIDDTTISGTWLDYNKASNTLSFSGNIVVHTPTVILTAEKAVFNLETTVNTFYQATAHDGKNDVFIEASRIEQIGQEKFVVRRGTITLCQPESKAWELRGRRIVYRVDDFAYSIHTSLHFYSVPIFYSPFFSFPTKKGRATGLLIPSYTQLDSSNKSKAYGARLKIPYFIALDRDHDLTLTADVVQRRGLGLDFDYQYAFLPGMRGQLKAWYLDETAQERDLDYEDLGGLSRNTDDLDTNPERHNYVFDHRQGLFFDGQLFVHQHGNSDNEVNKEYFDSKVTLDHRFSRTVSLVFPWKNGSLSLSHETSANFLQQSIFDTTADTDTHLNIHPSLEFFQRFAGIGGSPASLNLSGKVTNYERKYGWSGWLKQGSADLSFPFFIDFLNIVPGVRRDFYDYTLRYSYVPDTADIQKVEEHPRSFGWHIDAKNLEFNFELFRIFTNDQNVGTSKLSFRPRAIYNEVTDVDQTRGVDSSDSYVPNFIDPVTSLRSLTYRLETSYLTKNPETKKVREFLHLYFTQIYDLNHEGNKTVLNHPSDPETETGDPRLPLRIQLALSPVDRFSASLFYRYDHQKNRIIETVVGLSAKSPDGSSFSLGYTNNTKTYRELNNTNHPAARKYTVSHLLKFDDRLELFLAGDWDQNRNKLEANRLNRQLTSIVASLLYKHDCYNFTAAYSEEIRQNTQNTILKEELERKFSLTLSIPVLSGSGTSEAPVTEIPYRQSYLID
ncbi:MAG: LPS-assembly protein LptD [Proteobacteria bacterium]|nr:LPS-assembly protein LptD [Pseudomonadota bacterium]